MICFNLSGRVVLSNSFYRSEEKVIIRQKYKDTYLIWDQYDSFSIQLLPHNQHLRSCWIILPREFIQDVCDAAHHQPWQHGEDTRSPYVYIYWCARTGENWPNPACACSCLPDNIFDDFEPMFPSRLTYPKWLWTKDLMLFNVMRHSAQNEQHSMKPFKHLKSWQLLNEMQFKDWPHDCNGQVKIFFSFQPEDSFVLFV